ncbi:MAG: lipoprotein [Burkholderiales bacterium]|nr:lipoprotein [Burkholderiales bacterium]
MLIEMRQTSSPAVSEKATRRASGIFWRLSCFVLLGCFLGGCGIKGPLYLPQEKTVSTGSAPTEKTPAPASQDTTK